MAPDLFIVCRNRIHMSIKQNFSARFRAFDLSDHISVFVSCDLVKFLLLHEILQCICNALFLAGITSDRNQFFAKSKDFLFSFFCQFHGFPSFSISRASLEYSAF